MARYLALRDMTQGSGCTPRTVRYYERQGLLRAARTTGGHRLFDESELERLNFIIALREAGWSLEDVLAFFAMRDDASGSHPACERILGLLNAQVPRLEHKLEVLSRLRVELDATRNLLRTCADCTRQTPMATCGDCERFGPSAGLPRGFRLVWRDRSLARPWFDEHEGSDESLVDDEDEAPDEASPSVAPGLASAADASPRVVTAGCDPTGVVMGASGPKPARCESTPVS